jgi:hypothetical protein
MADIGDSKDLLEHLRTVHFTLLATCVAIAVIVLSPSPTQIGKADEQLDEVRAIVEQWNPQWSQRNAEDQAAQHKECNSDPDQDPLFLEWGTWKSKVRITRRWDVRYGVHGIDMKSPDGITPPVLPRPLTLQQFKDIWNSKDVLFCPGGTLGQTVDRVLVWNPTFHKFYFPGHEKLQAKSIAPGQVFQQRDFEWVITENMPLGPDEEGVGKRPFGILMQIEKNPKMDPFCIFTSTFGTGFGLEVRSRIVQDAKAIPGLQPKEFDVAFPELDQIAEEQNAFNTNLDYLKKSLASQDGAAARSFEVFSIKFPVEATARWAVILILSIQAYLWLQLNEYRRRTPRKTDIAWIGVYTNWAARAVSALSMLMIPVSVILLCVAHTIVPLQFTANVIISALVCLLSVSLAVLTGRALWFVNKALEALN